VRDLPVSMWLASSGDRLSSHSALMNLDLDDGDTSTSADLEHFHQSVKARVFVLAHGVVRHGSGDKEGRA
jgi:hypothetical protein